MKRALTVAALLAISCVGGRSTRTVPPPSTGGDPARGAEVISRAGCGACHVIPGIRSARGVVGPGLDGFATRTFVAGELPNTPENLVQWILNPRAVEPYTAMPVLGLSAGQARDAAAYLYTLD
jgi:cytochrome c2